MGLYLESINTKKQLEDTLKHMCNPVVEDFMPTRKPPVHFEYIKCPKCKEGHIVLRDGMHGYFGGCSKFPKCGGTMHVDKIVYESIKTFGFNLYKWDTQCWKCRKPIVMYGYFPVFEYSSLEDIFDFSNCRLGNIEEIDKYLEEKYSSIHLIYSYKAKKYYRANICPHKSCNEKQGYNFKLEDMRKWLMSLTKEERAEDVVAKIPVGDILSFNKWKRYIEPIKN